MLRILDFFNPDKMFNTRKFHDLWEPKEFDLEQARKDAKQLFNQWSESNERASKELVDFISIKGSEFDKFDFYSKKDCLELFNIFDLSNFREQNE